MISSVRCRASKRLQFPLDLAETWYNVGHEYVHSRVNLLILVCSVDEKGRDGEWRMERSFGEILIKKYGGTRDFSVER